MFRVRRYRIVLVATALAIVTVVHLTGVYRWDVPALEGLLSTKPGVDRTTTTNIDHISPPVSNPDPLWGLDHPKPPAIPETVEKPVPPLAPAPAAPAPESHVVPDPLVESTSTSSATTAPDPEPTETEEEPLVKQPNFEDDSGERVAARPDIRTRPGPSSTVSWRQLKEKFPVPTQKLIPLPTENPVTLPKIQHSFGRESASSKTQRLNRQMAVREAFKHAWFGYKNYSLPYDELTPVTRGYSNPFNGWGATLVDSLDALWIMGLHAEFEEAVTHVAKIDFKTSEREDIPLFETTIRYLGGLVGAYDVSEKKFPVLLDKAVELADILMGAFDTPNRMPIEYYYWMPADASQPHRASKHMVLAELGSLALEFTRLAQITKEARYYDAVARVTDALEEWQAKTTMPGLWPLKLDASGCKQPQIVDDADETTVDGVIIPSPTMDEDELAFGDEDVADETDTTGQGEDGTIDTAKKAKAISRRSFTGSALGDLDTTQDDTVEEALSEEAPGEEVPTKDTQVANSIWKVDLEGVECESDGLNTEASSVTHVYGIGAQADSTYEYFPKQFALLGGVRSQYKSMYLDSMDVVRTELLYRPMTKDERDILFVAKHKITPKAKLASKRKVAVYEGTHLGCFAGGMFALGSKMFNIPADMDIAEKLTDGCVWAYESTPAGVMAEHFELVPCDSLKTCKWDVEKWHAALDPYEKERHDQADQYNLSLKKLMEKQALEAELAVGEASEEESEEAEEQEEQVPDEESKQPQKADKGDEELEEQDDEEAPLSGSRTVEKRQVVVEEEEEEEEEDAGEEEEEDLQPTKTSEKLTGPLSGSSQMFAPKEALSHAEFVSARISEERLPPGYTKIIARDYRLRPEAIESVFIMYRLTGDESWQDKGWAMFTAVDRATRNEIAHAAVKDVTSRLGEQADSMESFWLAETLKYYYLLFSEPDLISLDEYVLNTEAHPFRRP